jgi:crotonobetainyl-CoA:carnitine CoA-transferase CaiB-like acyl-CoA transferase
MKSMKIKSDVHAGMTYAECDAQRNYWKSMAQSGHCTGYGPQPPYYPPYNPYPPSGGDYVNGVWYPDMSGACG